MPADFSVKQPNKRLAGFCIKAKVMHKNNNNNNNNKDDKDEDDATSDTSTYITTSDFVFRDYVSKDEQGLNVRPFSQTLTSYIVLRHIFYCEMRFNSSKRVSCKHGIRLAQ